MLIIALNQSLNELLTQCTSVLSRLLAWSCLAAAAVALIVAIYFTFRALTLREPQKESDLESEGDGSGESFRLLWLRTPRWYPRPPLPETPATPKLLTILPFAIH